MAVVFVPRETVPGETRVAATPGTVKILAGLGLEVRVQTEAGRGTSFPDEEYRGHGAAIVEDAAEGFAAADLVLKVEPPREGSEEVTALRQGSVLVCSLQPLLHRNLVRSLAERKVTVFALDLMPRITRAQKMDILSSQATVAGYEAVLLAAANLPKMFPLLMTAAGTITPAKVLVLGAGVAGLQAIATARRLGAMVEANDIRPAVKEQVESLGAKFVDTGTPPQAETTGGYARETSEEYARRQREILTHHVSTSDVVITTALIPGKRAPVLVTDDMVASMHEGSVIVDLAVAMGGNVEGSVAGETVLRHGVKIVGEPNLPALVPHDASRMFARNVVAFVELLVKDGSVAPRWDDEIVKATCVTHGGEIRHQDTARAMESEGAS